MKVLVLANFGMGLYNFRKELLKKLIAQNSEVYISLPKDEYVPKLEDIGCKFIHTEVDRRGTNPLKDFKLILHYIKILREIKPDVVLTYTIKPNIYGGLACRLLNMPYIANITGLGTSIENGGIMQKITLSLYKIGLKKSSCVFFQNKTNHDFFINNKVLKGRTRTIPGSGVNLKEHQFEEYPSDGKRLDFLFIGRIMQAKGINELFRAAQKIKEKYPRVYFHLVGGTEEDYKEEIDELESQEVIIYHGQQEDVHSFIKKSNATILPSHHEGLANVLLESAASGRPVLASRIPGCSETFDEGLTGIGFQVKDVEDLIESIVSFIELPYEQKVSMGLAARKKMEAEFDRNIVVDAYIDEINLIRKES